ncbi:hypothetical protein LshimejAT787_1500470 [Lyophyllum shimeji]|uniref:Uncharacterized protein n=1 Tax=Lyophyllum shimeji TaxID=47721 RepID=A0A9P3PYF9_LYOSH|nr:hypothetical protein LshimejAT787_1500470 [Lyophyllum shimeji]
MQSISRCKPQHRAAQASEQSLARETRLSLFPVHANGAAPSLSAHSAPVTPRATPLSLDIRVSTPTTFENHSYGWETDTSDIEKDELTDENPSLGQSRGLSPLAAANSCIPGPSCTMPLSSSRNLGNPSSTRSPCPGVPLNWSGNDFWAQYPFHRHSHSMKSLGYRFCHVNEKNEEEFGLRAILCEEISMPDGSPCLPCRGVTARVEKLASLSKNRDQFTNRKYLSHEQLCDRLAEQDETLNNYKLKAVGLGRKCASLMRKLDDYRRFLMATATGDVPRLQQLIRQGIKDGASISTLTGKIEQALEKTYHARSYTQTDFDISMMVLRLGGRRLLYAMNQYISIPSITSLRRASVFTQLMPSIGIPKLEDALFNMKSIFSPKIESLDKDRPFRTGMSILWDEVSLEETACYFDRSDCVGGLCREHSDDVNVRLSTFDNAVSIARALVNGTVHYGKEASVIAMASFNTKIRGAFPVIISPTCKRETPEESATLLTSVIEAWKQFGQDHFGPVWSFASDGDAGRRAMVYQLFMKYAIDSKHRLYKYLGGLPGLNLFVGDGDITGDFDWKHEIKRMARLMRTQDGMMVGRTIVNFETLYRHLCRNTALSVEAVELLMKPEDSQDVPRAIDFVNAVDSISTLPTEGCDPGELQEVQVINVIGEMFTAFMHPFIQPEMNLTEQVTSLSKYVHIAFALFRDFRVNLMPNQLYGDTQTTVKNVMFCIAKQQEMDGSQPFYLFNTGDDHLEVLFGYSRMQGGHNPNFSFKQFMERIGAAMDLDAVFGRNPLLFAGHRRLKVTRTAKRDHLNAESWHGNAVANSVDLGSAWLKGREQALTTLKTINIFPNFDALFDRDRKLDMLKPFGDGKYPGVSTDVDRSLEPILPIAQEDPLDSSSIEIFSADSDEVNERVSDHSTLEPQLNLPHPEPVSEEPALDDDFTLEEHLDELAGSPPTTDSENHSAPNAWLEHSRRKVHKSSICRLVITPDWIRKSHERTFRVRGYTTDSKPRRFNSEDSVLKADAFLVGDVFGTLVRCGKVVALAVLKCIALEEKGVRVERVKCQSLPHDAAGIKLLGQILDIRMVPADPDGTSGEIELPYIEPETHDWLWNGSFVKLDLDQTNPSPIGKAARKTVALKLSSIACTPLNPRIVKASHRFHPTDTPELNTAGLTWEFSNGELTLLAEKLWETVKDSKLGLSPLPVFRANSSFPYRSNDGTPLVSVEGSHELEAQQAERTNHFRCYQCLSEVEVKRARQHVGRHILKALRGIKEDLKGEPIAVGAGSMPCGFCGRSGNPACDQVFLSKGKSPQATSGCRLASKFHYQPSLKSTGSTPCTNVPILCSIAGCTGAVGTQQTAIWKYNMPEHIRTVHPGYAWNALGGDAPLPASLAHAMHITPEEEAILGIPKENIPPAHPLPPFESTTSRGSKRSSTNRPVQVQPTVKKRKTRS